MSMESQLFSSLKALYTADSGAGGLNNTSSTASVTTFLSDDDGDTEANLDTPRIVVEVMDQTGDTYALGGSFAPFKFHLFYNRTNEQFEGRMSAVLARVRTVFHRVTPAAGATWTFSPSTIARIVEADSGGKEGHKVIELRTTATKNSGV